jgi:hypothetical protein
MKRHELLALIAVSIALLVTGVTWWFGYYGLIGSGAVLLLSTFFIKREEE